ncbi:hypothetical protein Ddye_016276 [Dipteronia dyeriana]|uniref:Uncharacterized protein n=1 Tax=Dipteronia dyeriana TaxID=168575 RepID=A0AAD9U6K7_9ROSI|nr:hypothetical protein Ddye_016276 [Dipteronia dyeriana]
MMPLLPPIDALKRQMEWIEKKKGKKFTNVSDSSLVDQSMVVDLTELVTLIVEKTRKRPRQGNPLTKNALQSKLFFRKDVKSLSKKVSTLTSSNTKLKKGVEKTKSDSERLSKESTEKLARSEEEIAQLRSALVASEKKLSNTDDMLVDAFEKLGKAAYAVVIQTKGKLMNQYILREINSWRPVKDIEV